MSDDDRPDEDPVDRLAESVEDREGDPFEYLSDPEADEGAGGGAGRPDAGPGDAGDDRPDAGTGDADDGAEAGDGPGGAAGVRATGTADEALEEVSEPTVGPAEPEARTGDPFAGESVFREMDAADHDVERVWEALADAEERGSVAAETERVYAEVSKHAFCEGCEHFSGPPEVSCSHEGTEILEFLDMETVRVVDCPIVEERRDLEREG